MQSSPVIVRHMGLHPESTITCLNDPPAPMIASSDPIGARESVAIAEISARLKPRRKPKATRANSVVIRSALNGWPISVKTLSAFGLARFTYAAAKIRTTGSSSVSSTWGTPGGFKDRPVRRLHHSHLGYRNENTIGNPQAVEDPSRNRHRNRDRNPHQYRLAQIGMEHLCCRRGGRMRWNHRVDHRKRASDRQSVIEKASLRFPRQTPGERRQNNEANLKKDGQSHQKRSASAGPRASASGRTGPTANPPDAGRHPNIPEIGRSSLQGPQPQR